MPRQAKRNIDTEAPAFVDPMAGNADGGVQLRADGPVAHLTAPSLGRPLEFPRTEYRKLLVIAGVAVLFSIILIIAYNATVVGDLQRQQALVSEAISREVSLDLPNLQNYVGKTNEAMRETLKSDGYTIYDNSNDEDYNVDGFDLFKVASDIDPEKAGAAYSQGIENLKPVDAARYLAGSWRFLVSRADGVELRLRYADFESADARAAIEAALASQGFDDADLDSIAEDTMGNTNISGTFKKGKSNYEYTISACDLSQVYDIDGAPENAQYVGIRVKNAS